MQKQLHLVASATSASGGEGLAAWRYAEFLARAGCDVTLLTKGFSGDHVGESLGSGRFCQHVVPTRNNLLIELVGQYRFIQSLFVKNKFDLIHLHGMWTPLLAVAALVARRRSIPIILSPHGCLEPWALGYKKHKKWLALRIYQGAILRSVTLFVATAKQELESIRLSGFHQAVAIIPNGVDAGPLPHRDTHKTVKTILFLSRVHPIKGLLDLVEAWAGVRRPGWKIKIAGGGEEGYRAKVEALICAKKLQSDFEFVGFVEGASKQACFDSADIFILPTYSENFGIAVAEALANELPVITTTGAPWQDLVEHHCGWWVEPGVRGVSGALIEALDSDPEKLREMGRRGRQLVIDKYSWSKIGSTALEVSEWLLDSSQPKPEVVQEYEGR